jgi:hypothetical protein
MNENKTGRYVKYAIGEIILVVIGILIALQINNWNETNKNHKREQAILKELHKDFLSNKMQFDSIKLSYENALWSSKKLLDFFPFENTMASLDSFNKYRKPTFVSKGFNPKNGIIESLLNSTDYRLIRDDSLRNYVISWKDVLNDYLEDEEVTRSFVREGLSFFRKNMDNVNVNNPKNLEFIQTISFQNQILLRKQAVAGLLSAIKQEKIEFYINEILKLSGKIKN